MTNSIAPLFFIIPVMFVITYFLIYKICKSPISAFIYALMGFVLAMAVTINMTMNEGPFYIAAFARFMNILDNYYHLSLLFVTILAICLSMIIYMVATKIEKRLQKK